jgi:hypothetical protein
MKKGLLLLATLVLLSWGVYECKYYFSYWQDLRDRPWAYSTDKNAKLLIGHWKGVFKDPDGVAKNLEIEIFEPITDEEREQKASRKVRRRSRENKQGFEGKAFVESRLGFEKYEIYGAVEKDDFHQLHFNFRPEDEAKRVLPNFTLNQAEKGRWTGDQLSLTLAFAYHRADGSSHWNSADPRHNQKVILILNRK